MTQSSLSDIKPMPKPGKVILRFKWFTIREWDAFYGWMEIDGGEGKAIPKTYLMRALARLWGAGV